MGGGQSRAGVTTESHLARYDEDVALPTPVPAEHIEMMHRTISTTLDYLRLEMRVIDEARRSLASVANQHYRQARERAALLGTGDDGERVARSLYWFEVCVVAIIGVDRLRESVNRVITNVGSVLEIIVRVNAKWAIAFDDHSEQQMVRYLKNYCTGLDTQASIRCVFDAAQHRCAGQTPERRRQFLYGEPAPGRAPTLEDNTK